MCLEADDLAPGARLAADLERTLGDVLGEIADPFEIAGDADRADDLAQVDRHRLTAGDGEDRVFLDLALQRIEPLVARDDGVGEGGVGIGERVHGVDHHFLGDAAHLGDAALEGFELLVVGFQGVVGHQEASSSRSGQ